MTDKRKRCRAAVPTGRVSRAVTAYLAPDDYRALYEITMERGTSMAETIRQIIREAETRAVLQETEE